MKLFTSVILLFLLLTTTNTQDLFDYERFLTVFNIKFDYQRFVQTFLVNGQLDPTQSQPAFNEEEFIKTFFTPKSTNLVSEPQSSEAQPDQKFDIETFKRVFNLQCVGECPKDFDYQRFVDTFNLRDKEEKFDYQRFMSTFNLRISHEAFDWERFANTFFAKRDWPPFDYERFFRTFFGSAGQTKNGGAVLIVDGLSGGV